MTRENCSELSDSSDFYDFTSRYPNCGHCEYQQFGSQGPIKELGNVIFGLLTTILALVGLILSKSVAVGTRYMYSLLFGYGLTSMLHCATLWNGFAKTSGALLNLMQAVIIVRYATALKFAPFNNNDYIILISNVIMSTFGLYPVFAHVISSSYNNP